MKGQLTLVAVMLAMLAGCSKPATNEGTPEPGSAAAAKELAHKYVVQMFTAVDQPEIEGDTATVDVVVMNQKCVVTMQRRTGGNSDQAYGWLVSKQSCQAVNLSTRGANSPIVSGKGSQVIIHTGR